MADELISQDEEEHAEVGLGGITGGGMLGGGTPDDVAEGRSAFHTEEDLQNEKQPAGPATVDGGSAPGRDATRPGVTAPPTDIARDPADSSGTTDAGLSADGGTWSGTGGLVSGGLPGENAAPESG